MSVSYMRDDIIDLDHMTMIDKIPQSQMVPIMYSLCISAGMGQDSPRVFGNVRVCFGCHRDWGGGRESGTDRTGGAAQGRTVPLSRLVSPWKQGPWTPQKAPL